MNALVKPPTAEEESWMQTCSGRKFFINQPECSDIVIEDIASSLSKMCRFGGHCTAFYSVAEHSVLVAASLEPEHRLAGLLHDASEAYLVDIPRPVKPLLTNYYELEERLMREIAKRFGFQYPLPAEVKVADNRILRDERSKVMAPMDVPPEIWGDPLEGFGVNVQCWAPTEARRQFLQAFREYSK